MISVVMGSALRSVMAIRLSPFGTVMTSVPNESTRSVAPGGTTVVAVASSTTAGPSSMAPGGRSSRMTIAVGRASRPKTTVALLGRELGRLGAVLSGGIDAAEVAEGGAAHHHELDGRAGVGVAEAELVRGVEPGGEVLVEVLLVRLLRAGQRDRQRVLLAHVADVERVLHPAGVAPDALFLERGETLVLELLERGGAGPRGRARRAE